MRRVREFHLPYVPSLSSDYRTLDESRYFAVTISARDGDFTPCAGRTVLHAYYPTYNKAVDYFDAVGNHGPASDLAYAVSDTALFAERRRQEQEDAAREEAERTERMLRSQLSVDECGGEYIWATTNSTGSYQTVSIPAQASLNELYRLYQRSQWFTTA